MSSLVISAEDYIRVVFFKQCDFDFIGTFRWRGNCHMSDEQVIQKAA